MLFEKYKKACKKKGVNPTVEFENLKTGLRKYIRYRAELIQCSNEDSKFFVPEPRNASTWINNLGWEDTLDEEKIIQHRGRMVSKGQNGLAPGFKANKENESLYKPNPERL